jgi:nucleotide-binding universal stress UspA family protein
MATHGRSKVQRWLLGSVANKVLYAARNPLVIMRATQGKQTSNAVQLGTIVVPLDGSPSAEKILPYVVEMAKAMKIEVIWSGHIHCRGVLMRSPKDFTFHIRINLQKALKGRRELILRRRLRNYKRNELVRCLIR